MVKFNNLESGSFYFFRYDSRRNVKGWSDIPNILNKFGIERNSTSLFLIRKETEDFDIVLGANYIKAFTSDGSRSSIKRTISAEIPFSYIKKSKLHLIKTLGETDVSYANKLHYDLTDPDETNYTHFKKLAELIAKNEDKTFKVRVHQAEDLKRCIKKIIQTDKYGLSLPDLELDRLKKAIDKK